MKEPFPHRKANIAIGLVFAVLALFLVAATHYGTKTLSAIRAYVAAESRWTKAQKEAVSLLLRYIIEPQPELYAKINEKLELHAAFTISRETLMSEAPDRDLAAGGFQAADVHPDDIELLVWLSGLRDRVSYIERAFHIWAEADELVARLKDIAQETRHTVELGRMDDEARRASILGITLVDQQLTDLETAFSETLAEGGRSTHRVLFWLIVGTGAALVFIGYLVTSILFRRINGLNRELQESESRFRRVLEHSRDVIYELNLQHGTYEYVSPAVQAVLGYSPEQIVNGGVEFIVERVHPDDRESMAQPIRETLGAVSRDSFISETEYRIRTDSGDYIWINNQRMLVTDEDGTPVSIVGAVRDVSVRREYEARLERSLDEKRTLLAEIHHRVKNNLAVVSSLLELQRTQAAGEASKVLQDTESRIRSIAMIHDKLYRTDSFSDVDMREYIDEFLGMIAVSFASDQRKVRIVQQTERIRLDIGQAVPLGLILNELLTNAFKHGLTGPHHNSLTIGLERQGEYAVLRVTNTGAGLPDGFSLERTGSLGMTLIRILTAQLRGEAAVTQNGETTFRITFPVT